MTDESEEGTRWPVWVCDTVDAVQSALDSANTARTLATALPEKLVATPSLSFAWIGQTTADGIRIRSVPPGTDAPQMLSLEATEETLTERVESTGVVQIRDSTRLEETDSVLTLVDWVPEHNGSCLGIPIQYDSVCYGVLHLYTAATVSTAPSVLSTLGRTVGRRLRAYEDSEQLTRERQRLESLRSLTSHDLGNPLNIASGRVELAREECNSPHLEHVDGALERMDTLASRGVRLVEMGWQPTEYTDISLQTLAHDCWTDVEPESAELSVEETQILGERERLRIALNELLRNARVHNSGHITVEIGPLPASSGFYVADDGDGIPDDEREYVLETGYTTAENRDGVGLSIVTEIVGAHGWDIGFGPTKDGGTRIEIVTRRW